jgi:ankyrin repeat protein
MPGEPAYRLIRACASSLDEARALLEAEPSLRDARTGLGETPLHYLAVENHLDGVRFLHERGAALDVTNEFGESALLESLRLGNQEVAEYLLDHGADPHAGVPKGETVLHAAATGDNASLVRRVLALGVPVDSRDDLDGTPLFEAAWRNSLKAAEVLLAAGADVNARAAFAETPLHAAAADGWLEMARLLLRHGADPAARDARGDTPEDEARRKGHTEVAETIASSRGGESA